MLFLQEKVLYEKKLVYMSLLFVCFFLDLFVVRVLMEIRYIDNSCLTEMVQQKRKKKRKKKRGEGFVCICVSTNQRSVSVPKQ